MASHHHSCCRWLVASRCPCEPAQPTLDMFIVPAHLVTEDIIFRTKPPLAPLCLMVGPNSRVVCEIEPSLMTVVEDVSDQFATCDECCAPPPETRVGWRTSQTKSRAGLRRNSRSAPPI